MAGENSMSDSKNAEKQRPPSVDPDGKNGSLELLKQTPKQKQAQRNRSIGLAIALIVFVLIIYIGTYAKLGANVLIRPI